MLVLCLAAGREVELFAVLAALAPARLGRGFFARPFDEAFDAAALERLRLAGFEAVALFALGRTDFAFIVRPLTDDFGADRRAAVRDVDRLKPFVTGLLIRRFK